MNNVQLQNAIDKTRQFILDTQPIANCGPKYEAWEHAVATLKLLQSAQAQRACLVTKKVQA